MSGQLATRHSPLATHRSPLTTHHKTTATTTTATHAATTITTTTTTATTIPATSRYHKQKNAAVGTVILPTDGVIGLNSGDYLRLGPVCLNFILPVG